MPSGGIHKTFRTAEEYLRSLHPEYNFVFTIVDKATQYWGYSLEQACQLQSHMVTLVCEHAREADAGRGIAIIIEDETCSLAASTS